MRSAQPEEERVACDEKERLFKLQRLRIKVVARIRWIWEGVLRRAPRRQTACGYQICKRKEINAHFLPISLLKIYVLPELC